MPESPSRTPVPVSLKAASDALFIAWDDGVTHRITWRLLRDRCPCATCRTRSEEPPRPANLLPVLSAQEAQPLKVLGMRPVGNYAYAVEFNDGHNSGIYAFDLLRRLGEESRATDPTH